MAIWNDTQDWKDYLNGMKRKAISSPGMIIMQDFPTETGANVWEVGVSNFTGDSWQLLIRIKPPCKETNMADWTWLGRILQELSNNQITTGAPGEGLCSWMRWTWGRDVASKQAPHMTPLHQSTLRGDSHVFNPNTCPPLTHCTDFLIRGDSATQRDKMLGEAWKEVNEMLDGLDSYPERVRSAINSEGELRKYRDSLRRNGSLSTDDLALIWGAVHSRYKYAQQA